MSEKPEDTLAKILNLCESNPDAGLEFIEQTIRDNPESESDPFGKFAKAIAYGSKGLFQLMRSKPEVDFTAFDQEELRDDLGVTDTHLDYLEKGLHEIREMEELHPGALGSFGTEQDRMGERKVDAMAMVLERCRPGRVQEILGRTKLLYFGLERVKVLPQDLLGGGSIELPSGNLRPFMNASFSYQFTVKSALIVHKGRDSNGRIFIWVQLFGKTFAEFGANETFGDARTSKSLYDVKIFDDGTFNVY
jgi:hypothetical protein